MQRRDGGGGKNVLLLLKEMSKKEGEKKSIKLAEVVCEESRAGNQAVIKI